MPLLHYYDDAEDDDADKEEDDDVGHGDGDDVDDDCDYGSRRYLSACPVQQSKTKPKPAQFPKVTAAESVDPLSPEPRDP